MQYSPGWRLSTSNSQKIMAIPLSGTFDYVGSRLDAVPVLCGGHRCIARAPLAGIDASLPTAFTLLTLDQGPMEIQRLYATAPALVSSILGLLALLSAAIAIFGTVSFLVSRRTREIGIRIALGAQKIDVARMVLTQGLRSAVWGSAVWLLGALALSRLLSALVVAPDAPDLTYGAGAFNAGTFGILAGLATVVLIASLIPVWRASRVDPVTALRES
jgi:ABC-type antimicrobial peptide transport system permease subunit